MALNLMWFTLWFFKAWWINGSALPLWWYFCYFRFPAFFLEISWMRNISFKWKRGSSLKTCNKADFISYISILVSIPCERVKIALKMILIFNNLIYSYHYYSFLLIYLMLCKRFNNPLLVMQLVYYWKYIYKRNPH